MKKILLVAVCCAFVMLAGNAFAYRPFNTDGAEVVGKGTFVDELGWDYFEWKNKDTDNIFSTFMFLGLSKNLHVGVGVPYVIHNVNDGDRTSGVGDIYYYAKYVAVRDAKDTAIVAYKFQGKADNGDYNKFLGYGDKEYQFSICLTQPLGDLLQIHGQLGYNFVSAAKNENYQNYINYGVAADFAYTKKTHFLFEISGNENPDKTLQDQKVGMAGVTYAISDHFVADVNYRKGLTDTSQKYQVGAGLSVIF